jgi:hypothetical protein
LIASHIARNWDNYLQAFPENRLRKIPKEDSFIIRAQSYHHCRIPAQASDIYTTKTSVIATTPAHLTKTYKPIVGVLEKEKTKSLTKETANIREASIARSAKYLDHFVTTSGLVRDNKVGG